jgi:two-component SAPR family response regulator
MNVKRYNSTAAEISDEMPDGSMLTFTGMVRHAEGEYVLYKDYKWMADYADRLVEHSNLPCLPADLDNLRNANASLATEVYQLKKLLAKYKNNESI